MAAFKPNSSSVVPPYLLCALDLAPCTDCQSNFPFARLPRLTSYFSPLQVGYTNLGKSLVNAKNGPPTFEQPRMTLDILLAYGNKLVEEQENVKRVQFAEEYLSGAALGDANKDSIASGSFYGASSDSGL